ncbi:hypothetical protein [Formosa haliotis]|uniref:hypothetical protein n=1 Tax=Formosa haliotis TaxID=1555194 RepID=UPI000827098A|nr:hypothetical protein [Formosa haliotis]
MNIKILLYMLCLAGCFINQGYAQEERYLKYPHTEISNDNVTMSLFLPDRKKGFYQGSDWDWSGLIASLEYKGQSIFKASSLNQKSKTIENLSGPIEEATIGYTEATNSGKFIRLGVGILQKPKRVVNNSEQTEYKILDHGTWKINYGADWIDFTHTISSDFGYAYIYKKRIKLSKQGFVVEHAIQNTGSKPMHLEWNTSTSFKAENNKAELPFQIIYPYKIKTENTLEDYVNISGNAIQFTKALGGLSVNLNLKGFESITPNTKLTIENPNSKVGLTMSIDQNLIKEQLFANGNLISLGNRIAISVPVNGEKTWITHYFLYDTKSFQRHVNYKIDKVKIESEVYTIMQDKWNNAFKHVSYPEQFLDYVIEVSPGESIQSAIDTASAAGGGVVVVKKGIHYLEDTLLPRSNVTLVGERQAETIIMQGPDMLVSGINVEPEHQVTDFVIKDLILQGTRKGKANGIRMSGKNGSRHNRIMFQNITVRDWSAQGVHLKRTDNIIMDHCDFQYNGSGGGLYHNVYFLYNKYILQSDCDMSNPIKGKGNKYTSCEFVLAQRCKIRDANGNGIQADHEEAGYIFLHKFDISGCGRVALWFPCENYYDKYNYTENPKYAPQNIILNRCNVVDNTWGAMWRSVKESFVINCTFNNKKIDMGLLHCDVTIENSEFITGNQTYSSVDQWPGDVKLLW